MLRSLRHHLLTGENRRNTFSGLVILLTMAFFYWNTDPILRGGADRDAQTCAPTASDRAGSASPHDCANQ